MKNRIEDPRESDSDARKSPIGEERRVSKEKLDGVDEEIEAAYWWNV